MKLSNRLNLPDAIVAAVQNDEYSHGTAHISVTGLLRPPRIGVLEKAHENELESDVSEHIWSLMGQSIHSILERANKTGIAERRLSMECNGWQISGGMDLVHDDGILTDYKMTSVWKIIKGIDDEWEKQLNLYAVLLRQHGHQVKRLQVVTILRDWSKMKASLEADYPQAQVVNIEIPLWPEGVAIEFMKERVILHQQASLENLPLCTPAERWQREDVFAVMKIGRKSAVKLYDNENEALKHIEGLSDLSLVKRPGLSVRCREYCSVSQFCKQYQSSLKQGE